MKKSDSKAASKADVDNLVIEFATLSEDLKTYAAAFTKEEYRDFVTRIAANIDMFKTKFEAFTNAINDRSR